MTRRQTVLLLPGNLHDMATLTSDNSPRLAVTAVRVEALPSNKYRVEATNGRVLGRVEGPCDDCQTFPNIPALESAPNGATQALIPADAWKQIFRSVPKSKRLVAVKPVLGNVAAVLADNTSTLATTDLEVQNVQTPRNVDGHWPNTEQVLRSATHGKPKLELRIDASQLIDLLRVAARFATDAIIDLELRGDKVPIVVRASSEGQEFTGLLAPLAPTSPATAS